MRCFVHAKRQGNSSVSGNKKFPLAYLPISGEACQSWVDLKLLQKGEKAQLKADKHTKLFQYLFYYPNSEIFSLSAVIFESADDRLCLATVVYLRSFISDILILLLGSFKTFSYAMLFLIFKKSFIL